VVLAGAQEEKQSEVGSRRADVYISNLELAISEIDSDAGGISPSRRFRIEPAGFEALPTRVR